MKQVSATAPAQSGPPVAPSAPSQPQLMHGASKEANAGESSVVEPFTTEELRDFKRDV